MVGWVDLLTISRCGFWRRWAQLDASVPLTDLLDEGCACLADGWTTRPRAGVAAHGPPEVAQFCDAAGNIDHPYRQTFGEPSQSHPLRALCFDHVMREFLAEHPGGTVVSLGEGLKTGFWCIADSGVLRVSVDLPETIALREQSLLLESQVRKVACSALDWSWMDAVEPDARGHPR